MQIACSGSESNESEVADHLRSFAESKYRFIPSKDSMNTKSISGDEVSLILGCENPSTSERLETKNYTASYKKLERNQSNLDMPVVVTLTETGYSTITDGELFNTYFSMDEFALDGKVVVQKPYTYMDSCTLSTGCDIEKRKFSTGSPMAIVKAESAADMAYRKAVADIANLGCRDVPDEDAEVIDDVIQEGAIDIKTSIYTAVEVTSKQYVKIICGKEEVAKGIRVSRQVVIGDLLPRTSEFTVQSVGSKSLSCPRTEVFSGSSVSFGSEIVSGSSRDLAEYTLEGEVLSLEDWKAQQAENLKTQKELEKAVVLATSRRDSARANLAAAKSDASSKYTAYSQLQDDAEAALQHSEDVQNNPEATPAEKTAANTNYLQTKAKADNAKKTFDVAEKAVVEAQHSFDVAQETLDKAKQALQDFKNQELQNKTGVKTPDFQ